MARKHAFFIVVLLAAAALAGFTAFARSVDQSQTAAATAAPAPSEPALKARLRQLDRFEAKLRKQLASKPAVRKSAPAPVITRVASAPTPVAYNDDEDEDDENEHEEEDD